MSRAKDKGTWAETAVVEYAGHSGFPYADRLTLKGANDRGDVGWCPGVISEVKNDKSMDLPAWLRETEAERINAKAAVGFLVVKPPGIGRTRVGQWWSAMYQGQWDELRAQAGLTLPAPCHRTYISGANYKKTLPAALREPGVSAVVIKANGVKNDRDWYVVTRLEQQATLLRAAGYGNPEVLA